MRMHYKNTLNANKDKKIDRGENLGWTETTHAIQIPRTVTADIRGLDTVCSITIGVSSIISITIFLILSMVVGDAVHTASSIV